MSVTGVIILLTFLGLERIRGQGFVIKVGSVGIMKYDSTTFVRGRGLSLCSAAISGSSVVWQGLLSKGA